jgi:hypothetical protein
MAYRISVEAHVAGSVIAQLPGAHKPEGALNDFKYVLFKMALFECKSDVFCSSVKIWG